MLPSFDTVNALLSSADSATAVGLNRCARQKRPVPYLLLLLALLPASASAAAVASGC
jgi:hypothetical protein